MKKRSYRAISVNRVDEQRLAEEYGGKRLRLGVDTGKDDMLAALMNDEEEITSIVSWKSRSETRTLIDLLESSGASRIEVAMEPSSSYGDPLRWQLTLQGIPVYRVGTKRSHDAREVFDGVPSTHDAKAATVVAQLHARGLSEPWEFRDEEVRRLRSAVDRCEMYDRRVQSVIGRTESRLARYWPELTCSLDLTSATLPEVLATFGGPAGVAKEPRRASEVMRKASRGGVPAEKRAEVIESARSTIGVATMDFEVDELKELGVELLLARQRAKEARQRVEEIVAQSEVVSHLEATIGMKAAAMIVAKLGDPSEYACASSFLKALGLNLKEESSGEHKGRLRITRRGPGSCRWYLYLSVLRLVYRDAVIRAWYLKKVDRDGGLRKKALIAVMRKVAKALWYVAQGHEFDSSKLFDTSRLNIQTV